MNDISKEAGDIDVLAPPISAEDAKEKRIAVVEIFGPTIQGEGPLAGTKTMFIRFGGCDFRCQKCDSLHAVIPKAVKKHARYLTAEEIVDELVALRKATGTVWVTLSGGNPVMWDLTRLMHLLRGNNFAIAVETQGSLFHPWLLLANAIVVSPKSPGMGEKFDAEKFAFFMQNTLTRVPVSVKVVVFSALDIEFAFSVWEIIQPYVPATAEGQMFLSLGNPYPPVLDAELNLVEDPRLQETSHLKELMECYRQLIDEFVHDGRLTHWRFLPQLHVLAYGNEAER